MEVRQARTQIRSVRVEARRMASLKPRFNERLRQLNVQLVAAADAGGGCTREDGCGGDGVDVDNFLRAALWPPPMEAHQEQRSCSRLLRRNRGHRQIPQGSKGHETHTG